MSSLLLAAVLVMLFMLGLWAQVHIFLALREDPISTYGLFAVRDRLIRLVAEGKIERTDPHFCAIYEKLNALLSSSHCLSGPDGWRLAVRVGQIAARDPNAGGDMPAIPKSQPPEALIPVAKELRMGLEHLVRHHFGIITLIDSHRREQCKIQRERAKEFLDMMPSSASAV